GTQKMAQALLSTSSGKRLAQLAFNGNGACLSLSKTAVLAALARDDGARLSLADFAHDPAGGADGVLRDREAAAGAARFRAVKRGGVARFFAAAAKIDHPLGPFGCALGAQHHQIVRRLASREAARDEARGALGFAGVAVQAVAPGIEGVDLG